MSMHSLGLAVTLLAAATFLVGCGSDATSMAKLVPAADTGHDDNCGHDHDGHTDCEQDGHDHSAEGPHGGHLVELGNEEYHVELLHDEATHSVTVHLLDATGKQPVAVPLPEVTLQLLCDGQFVRYGLKAVAGDPSGAASQFKLVDETLCDAFCHESLLRGRIQLTIADKVYAGELEHACHEDHDHDHAGHKDHDVDETNAADGHEHDREPRTARRGS